MAGSDINDQALRLRARPVLLGSVVLGLKPFLGLSDRSWADLVAGAGLSARDLAGEGALVPLERGLRVFEVAAEKLQRPDLGIAYAAAFPVGGTGALGFALVNARTVREAMRTLARYMPLVSSMRVSRYVEDGAAGALVWQYPIGPAVPRLQYMSWGVAIVMARLGLALPQGWRPHAVAFDVPAPAHRTCFDDHFGPALTFGSALNHFAVDAAYLDLPMPDANETLYALMTRLAELEQKARGASGSAFEEQLRMQLAELIKIGTPRMEDLATALDRSPSGLRAEMQAHDLDFKRVLNEVRRSMAHAYLTETNLSITEITFALGYSDCSIFTRACRKWFGKPPRDIRRSAA